jgi:transposase InsO family protein
MQVYGAILPRAETVARLLPGAAAHAQAEAALSCEARHRLRMIRWYEEHGRNARLTCRHYGKSPDTFYHWLRRYEREGPRGLEDRSRRPHRVRKPTWSKELAQAVLHLREEHPRWGKDKLVVLLRKDGWQVSTSMVGRILKDLKERGLLWEPDLRDPWVVKRSPKRPYATRKPPGYVPKAPGDLVEADTADIRFLPGEVYKHFTARDVVGRWDVLDVHYRATGEAATSFLDTILERMPFPVKAIQVDGGSEFKAVFEEECRRRGILLFELPPHSPRLNGHVERAHRTHREEFYQIIDPPETLAELRERLRAHETVYNTIRPHQALGQRTPWEFYQEWLATQTTERG